MNATISKLIREKIKDGLDKLPESWQNMFKRMYKDVDTMPDEKLDHALTQVENSLNKLNIN